MKKLWKKFLATAIAMMMVVALLPAVAMAAEITGDMTTINYNNKGSLKVVKTDKDKNPLEGAKFTLYKIASLTKDKGYELLVTTTNYQKIDDLQKVAGTGNEGAAAAEFSEAVTDGNKVGEVQTTDDTGGALWQNLELGYYLVKETEAPAGYVASVPFFVAIPTSNKMDGALNRGDETDITTGWSYNVRATPKNKEVTVDKKITSTTATDQTGKNHSAGVGDQVEYEITSTSPAYTAEYFKDSTTNPEWKNPSYIITDMLSNGLTYDKNAKVYVGDTELTNSTEGEWYTIEEVTDEAATHKKGFKVTFTQKFLKEEQYKTQTIKVKYSATVNEDAVVGTGNDNEVKVNYNRTPNSETDGLEDKTPPKTYTYGLELTKVDNANQTKLPNAVFELYKVETKDDKETETEITNLKAYNQTEKGYVTNANGLIDFTGLNVGTYRLKEIKAPAGYTLQTDKIEFTITDTEPDGKINSVSGSGFSVKEGENGSGYITVTITNKKGFSLPSTGGAGTILYTAVGLLIMAGAALLMMSRKRRV